MILSLPPKPKRQYEDWVTDLQPWNDLAHELEIQLLMVHHKGKEKLLKELKMKPFLAAMGSMQVLKIF